MELIELMRFERIEINYPISRADYYKDLLDGYQWVTVKSRICQSCNGKGCLKVPKTPDEFMLSFVDSSYFCQDCDGRGWHKLIKNP